MVIRCIVVTSCSIIGYKLASDPDRALRPWHSACGLHGRKKIDAEHKKEVRSGQQEKDFER